MTLSRSASLPTVRPSRSSAPVAGRGRFPLRAVPPSPFRSKTESVLTALEFVGPDHFIVASQGNLATLAPNGVLTRFAVPDSFTRNTAWTLDQVLPDGWVLARYWRNRRQPDRSWPWTQPRATRAVDRRQPFLGRVRRRYAGVGRFPTEPSSARRGIPRTRSRWARDAAGRRHRALHPRIRTPGDRSIRRAGLRPDRVACVASRVARSGQSTVLLGTDRAYHNPRVSPDGRRHLAGLHRPGAGRLAL